MKTNILLQPWAEGPLLLLLLWLLLRVTNAGLSCQLGILHGWYCLCCCCLGGHLPGRRLRTGMGAHRECSSSSNSTAYHLCVVMLIMPLIAQIQCGTVNNLFSQCLPPFISMSFISLSLPSLQYLCSFISFPFFFHSLSSLSPLPLPYLYSLSKFPPAMLY